MKTPADATVADRLKLMSLKKEVMASVLSTGVRVNDGALRQKKEDKVAKLLDRVRGKVNAPSEPLADETVTINDLF